MPANSLLARVVPRGPRTARHPLLKPLPAKRLLPRLDAGTTLANGHPCQTGDHPRLAQYYRDTTRIGPSRK